LKADFFSVFKTPVDFFIVRHGRSEGNSAKVFQGREESPLCEEGRLQAAARGRYFRTTFNDSGANNNAGKTLLFSSPLGRARETAEIMAKEASLPEPVCKTELLEMNLGIWSGKNLRQAQTEDPGLWEEFMARSWDAIPEAESSSDLYSRALIAWSMLRDAALEYNAKNVIIVTHGGLIQWLLKSTLQNHSWFPLLPISNCGLFKLHVEPGAKGVYMFWEEINAQVHD